MVQRGWYKGGVCPGGVCPKGECLPKGGVSAQGGESAKGDESITPAAGKQTPHPPPKNRQMPLPLPLRWSVCIILECIIVIDFIFQDIDVVRLLGQCEHAKVIVNENIR